MTRNLYLSDLRWLLEHSPPNERHGDFWLHDDGTGGAWMAWPGSDDDPHEITALAVVP